jgi:hypothetical protein
VDHHAAVRVREKVKARYVNKTDYSSIFQCVPIKICSLCY